MAKGFIGASGCKAYLGAVKMRKGYIGATRVYSAGNIVTFHVDAGLSYQEEVGVGESCLSPKNFTPAKSGWEFVGWRQDTAANSNVLSSKVMGDDPITLYAVFKQSVTVTYFDNSTSPKNASGYRYYNNSNVANPSFALTQAGRSGWTARGWSTSTAGNGGISYNNGSTFTRDSNVTLYGMYYQSITLTYYNGSTTAATTSGTRYYNSGSGGVVNPTFTLKPTTLSGWTFRGWASSSAATAGITYSSISGTAFVASTTVYAAYSQVITLSYNGNGNTSGSTAAQTGTRYFNTGNYSNPSFTLATNGFNRANYTFSKWALGSASGTQYAAGASVTLSANTTMYAVWTYVVTPYYIVEGTITKQTLTWTYLRGSNINPGIDATRWDIGNNWPSVSGGGIDYSKESWFEARSSTISTKGNKSIRISWSGSTAGQYVEINGVKSQYGATSGIWDISGLDTIQIIITAERYGQTGAAWIQFAEIYLF